MLVIVLLSLVAVRVCDAQVINLSNPQDPFTAAILEGIRTGKPLSRIDGCVVSEEAAQVHYKNGERNYEESWIDYVNDDNTVQVTTVSTKRSFLFSTSSNKIRCFRKNSIASVTIGECKETREHECDFSLPHIVYVRTEPVQVLNWKYKNAF